MFVPRGSSKPETTFGERDSGFVGVLVGFRPVFCAKYHRNLAVRAGLEKRNRQILHGLSEFVLQNCISELWARLSLSVGASLFPRSLPSLEHT